MSATIFGRLLDNNEEVDLTHRAMSQSNNTHKEWLDRNVQEGLIRCFLENDIIVGRPVVAHME